ncbi:MAG TPA: hypothetical protein QGH10_18835, partial [Armatimonadota bacterium]|nr:hypothetical protein [Armatimonadota bacterium]
KPLLLGSVALNDPDDWVDKGNNIWSTVGPEEAEPVRTIVDPAADPAFGLWHEGEADARLSRDGDDVDSPPVSIRVECVASGEKSNEIQVSLSPLSLNAGTLLRLSARAKCTKPFGMPLAMIQKNGPPWTAYGRGAAPTVQITGEWQTFTHDYLNYTTADDARLTFYLGGMIPDDSVLHIDSVSLIECVGAQQLPADVGNIIVDGGPGCGRKKFNEEELAAPGDYWYDEARHIVKLYARENPAVLHESLELAIKGHGINQGGKHHVTYENLAVMYAGSHGIGGGSTHHIIVRACDFGFVRGGRPDGGRPHGALRERHRVLGFGQRLSRRALPAVGDLRCRAHQSGQRRQHR